MRFSRDPVGFLERNRRRYGDVFSLSFPGFGRMIYLADPALVKEVFTGDPATFHAGAANARALEPILGKFSLLTLDREDHMRQRKLLLPPFHGEAVQRYRDLIAEITTRDVERWPVGEPFALRPRMQAITLEVILRAVFGIREEERLDLFRTLLPRLGEATGLQMWLPFLRRDLGPWSPWARFLKLRAEVDALVYDEIRRRRSEPDAAERDDVLSLLLGARHEDGSPMSDRELRDELITLLTAGHETSATGLAWAFERLLRNPAAMQSLQSEIEEGGDEYADAVVKETLRVRPVIVDVARLVMADVDLGPWTRAGGHDRRARDRARAVDARGVSGAAGVPARAIPGRSARAVHMDPLRGRRAQVPGSALRPARDPDGDADRAGPGHAAGRRSRAGARPPASRDARPGPGRARRDGRAAARRRPLPHPRRRTPERRSGMPPLRLRGPRVATYPGVSIIDRPSPDGFLGRGVCWLRFRISIARNAA